MLIHLHIGMDKAGSSAIQSNMKLNRDWFLKSGLFIPSTGLTTTGYWKLFRQLTEDNFVELHDELSEAANLGFEQSFLSWEGINTYSQKQIDALARLFSRYDIKIYIYLREQSEIIQSGYFQQVKTREQSCLLSEFHQNPRLLCPDSRDYWALLQRFSASFGQDSINVRVFDRSLLKENNVVVDMLDMLGLEPDSEFKLSPSKDNPSLDMVGVKIMNLLDHSPDNTNWPITAATNHGFWASTGSRVKKIFSMQASDPLEKEAASILNFYYGEDAKGRKDIVDVLLNIIDMEGGIGKYFLDEKDCTLIKNFYAESNRNVVNTFFKRDWPYATLFPYKKPRVNDASAESINAAILSRLAAIATTGNHRTWDGMPLAADELRPFASSADGWEKPNEVGLRTTDDTATIRFRVDWKHINFTHKKLLLVVTGVVSDDYTGTSVWVNNHDLGVHGLKWGRIAIPLDLLAPLGLVDLRLKHNYSPDNRAVIDRSEVGQSSFTLTSLKYGRRP